MTPWRNRKVILAAVLLIAAAIGGYFVLNNRRAGREAAKPKPAAAVRAQMGSPAPPAAPAASTQRTPARSTVAAAKAVAATQAAGAAKADAVTKTAGATTTTAAAPAAGTSPSARASQATSAPPPARPVPAAAGKTQKVTAASAFAQEPEADPTDRLAHWVREPYYYASLGRRDPFASLVDGNFQSDGQVGLVDVGDVKLVGIAWDDIDRFAMVEDSRGFGHALRVGDPVRSGRVLRIERDSVTFLQTSAGESTTITINLPIREGD